MLVSIIVPVYNVEKYIDKCIQSILTQTYTHFELIIIDDGSPDNCSIICDNYAKKDNRITVIHQRNSGLSDARNSGLKIAKGAYVWFVDSDDWILKDALSIIIKELNKEKVEILGFSMIEFYEDKNVFSKPILSNTIATTNGNKYIKENGGFYAPVCSYIYKNSFLKHNNFLFKIGLIHEDDYFNLKCFSKVQKIKKILNGLYFYRKRTDSIINSSISLKRIQSYIQLIKLSVKLRESTLEMTFIENQILGYTSVLFTLLHKFTMPISEKKEIFVSIRKEVDEISIFVNDTKTKKNEKKLFNFNLTIFYFYINYLRWFRYFIENKIKVLLKNIN